MINNLIKLEKNLIYCEVYSDMIMVIADAFTITLLLRGLTLDVRM